VKPEHDQARDEGRPPEPEHGRRTKKGRSFHCAEATYRQLCAAA
jgi:hypothetical protein